MRRHHQEVHVIDDRLIGHQLAVVVLGVAELREEVVALDAAALGDFASEKSAHELVALEAAAHRGARQRHADDADRRRKAMTALTAKMARVAHAVVKTGTEYRPFLERPAARWKDPSLQVP